MAPKIDMAQLKLWLVLRPGPMVSRPLDLGTETIPEPGSGEMLVRVLASGVCRTDLHVTEGDLPPHAAHVIPGHEVVGEVVAVGNAVQGFASGDRVGIAWLRHTRGTCRYCRRGAENPLSEPVIHGMGRRRRLRRVRRCPGRLCACVASELFGRRTSESSNTRADAHEFLNFAGAHRLQVSTVRYSLGDGDRASADLAAGGITGAGVLIP